MTELAIRVESYSGYKGDQRPVKITFRQQVEEVAEIEDRWYSPGETFFRVRLTCGDRCVLRHIEAQDVWTIETLRAGKLSPLL
ncbi:MAG TPA: hypothetical protein VLV88_11565 [Terriglobales bacterium]|nr:hypothetical protein [Terriglobales bacterium]